LYVCILRRTHIPVDGVDPADRAEAQKGDEYNQYAETDCKHE